MMSKKTGITKEEIKRIDEELDNVKREIDYIKFLLNTDSLSDLTISKEHNSISISYQKEPSYPELIIPEIAREE